MSKLNNFFTKAFSDAALDYFNFKNSRTPYLNTTKILDTPDALATELNRVTTYMSEPKRYAKDLVNHYGLDMIGDNAEQLFNEYLKHNDPSTSHNRPNSLENILYLQSLGNPTSKDMLERVTGGEYPATMTLKRYNNLTRNLPDSAMLPASIPSQTITLSTLFDNLYKK